VADFRRVNTPEIMEYARSNYGVGECVSWRDLARKLRRRKMALKRSYAKNRSKSGVKQEYYVISGSVEGANMTEQSHAEIKKKRNRVSAQVSRDRKK
jgi:hypothetical protein